MTGRWWKIHSLFAVPLCRGENNAWGTKKKKVGKLPGCTVKKNTYFGKTKGKKRVYSSQQQTLRGVVTPRKGKQTGGAYE